MAVGDHMCSNAGPALCESTLIPRIASHHWEVPSSKTSCHDLTNLHKFIIYY